MKTSPIQGMAYAGLCLTLTLAGPVRGATTAVAAATPEMRVHCRIETDRSVLPARTQENTILKITLEAADAPAEAQRTPVNLSIVLDRSGSMRGAKIEHARQAAIEAVRHLRPDDIVSLVTYESQIKTVIPPQQVRNIAWMEEQIRRIQPSWRDRFVRRRQSRRRRIAQEDREGAGSAVPHTYRAWCRLPLCSLTPDSADKRPS